LSESAAPARDMRGSRALLSIQILRAVAALGVLFHHTAHEVAAKTGVTVPFAELVVGAGGVDLFFVISGFVMVYASERLFAQPGATRIFFLRRLARIVPLYWAATAILVGYIYVAHRIFPPPFITTEGVISSFLFIPYPLPNGLMAPVHALGWTLNYEMFFYLLFGLCLFIPAPRIRVGLLAAAFLLLVIAGLLFEPSGAVARTYTDPILLEFLAGVMLAILSPLLMRCGVLSGLALTAAGIIWVAVVYGYGFAIERIAANGVPAVVAVAGALMIEPAAHARPNRFWLMLGDSSYSIYLAHPFAQRLLLIALNRTVGVAAIAPILYVPTALIVGIAGGVICHFLIERPLLIAGREVIGRSQPTR